MTADAGQTWSPPLADVAVPLAELPWHWRATEIVVRCRRPRGFETGFSLAGRVRGAFGEALRRGAVGRPHSLRALPPACRVLFTVPPPAPEATGPLFHNKVRPYVLFTEDACDAVIVTLRLFGYAAAWLVESRTALVAGLEAGVSVAPGARVRAPLAVLGVDTRQRPRPAVPEDIRETLVSFESPVCLARGPAQAVDGDAVLGSLFARLAGLATWHGIALQADFGALAATTAQLRIDLRELRPIAWERVAVRQGGRRVPMTGVIGSAWLSGPLAAFGPALVLAPLAHLGSHTAFGMGRCQVTCIG